MKVFLVVAVVAWFHGGGVKCEDDFDFGPPPLHYPFALAPQANRHNHHHQHHHQQPHQYNHNHGQRQYAEYGSGPAVEHQPQPQPQSHHHHHHHQPKQQFRVVQPHPNAIPPPNQERQVKQGFEIVRAPVIFQETVTDTNSDVSKALANAFGVVQKLRKPGGKYESVYSQYAQQPVAVPVRTLTNVEFVNHGPQQQQQQQQGQRQSRPGPITTTTTTIVDADAPQLLGVTPQRPPVIATTVPAQTQQAPRNRNQRPPVPSAADLPPSPRPVTVIATTVPRVVPTATNLLAQPPPITVVTTSSVPSAPRAFPIPTAVTLAQPPTPITLISPSSSPIVPSAVRLFQPPPQVQYQPAPKLIIPSHPHVTTLEQAVQSGDPQIRTIIQPVYIPYAVDQNGQQIGPIPDYHNMDFGALLNAQNQLLTVAPLAQPNEESAQPTIHLLDTQTLQQLHQQPQQAPPQYLIQQDQAGAAATSTDTAPEEPSPSAKSPKFGRRLRKVKKGRRLRPRTQKIVAV